jgi:hypothetical protein
MGTTIVVHDKWERQTSASVSNMSSAPSAVSVFYGEHWFLILILSIIITWFIGLLPPVLIRFVILKRPMDKRSAIGTCVFFWFFNFFLFTALGSRSKHHGALLLVAAASYWLLRKGAKNPPVDERAHSGLALMGQATADEPKQKTD